MTITERRNRVKAAYPTTTWASRVDAMSDNQVFAVYQRLLAKGKV